MRSVPPGGSGWVLPIVDFQLPIANWRVAEKQSEIGNLQLAIESPTRYREVVLTSCHESERS